jgi:hypothetical protein
MAWQSHADGVPRSRDRRFAVSGFGFRPSFGVWASGLGFHVVLHPARIGPTELRPSSGWAHARFNRFDRILPCFARSMFMVGRTPGLLPLESAPAHRHDNRRRSIVGWSPACHVSPGENRPSRLFLQAVKLPGVGRVLDHNPIVTRSDWRVGNRLPVYRRSKAGGRLQRATADAGWPGEGHLPARRRGKRQVRRTVKGHLSTQPASCPRLTLMSLE